MPRFLSEPGFLKGVVAGVILVYLYHHFMSPLPLTGKSPAAKRTGTAVGG